MDGGTFSNNTATWGGGMHNDASSPTLTGVTFTGNTASQGGGGMENLNSSPTLEDVLFENNTAHEFGGGMHNNNSYPVLGRTVFDRNRAEGATLTHGGAILNWGGGGWLNNVEFWSNSATFGGAVRCDDCNMVMVNNLFKDNTAANQGGAILSGDGSMHMVNATVVQNGAGDRGGGLYVIGPKMPSVRNSVFWGNTGPAIVSVYERQVFGLDQGILASTIQQAADAPSPLNADLLPVYPAGAGLIDAGSDERAGGSGRGRHDKRGDWRRPDGYRASLLRRPRSGWNA